jgi:NADPH-dependent curcumin reductase CurA
MVCQLARRNGNRVIGSAGGPDKVALLKTIGVDAVIDYKNCEDLSAALAQAAPDGIDVYFDNVGGEHLDAALHSANTSARFVLCGMISHYNAENARHPVYEMSDAVFKQIALKGFIITSYMDGFGDFIEAVAPDIAAGRIVSTETVRSGIHNAVPAFLDLFSGNNTGKMLVDLT